jgi:hypothetical protein
MTFIAVQSRFWPRSLVLAAMAGFVMVGFAGASHTISVWNGTRAEELEHERQHRAAIAAIETKQAEVERQTALAESYSRLGLRQATCGDTLQGFSYSPETDIYDQLNGFGFDWGTPRYNTEQWFPLFDSAGLLFAAIRVDPSTGRQTIARASVQRLDQGAICNLNRLEP